MNDSARRRVETVAAVVAALIAGTVPAHAQHATNIGSVEARANVGAQGKKKNFASKVLSAKEKVRATQPVKTVPKFMFELVSPQGGGLQALGTLPNVYISGYNVGSASARNTISMRGVKVGFNSIPGDLETNAITAEFDGIPLNSLSQGTGWHSTETPIGALLSGLNVIEGAGNPRDRWYNSLGGTINFVPVQPTGSPGGRVSLSGGSFSSTIASAVFNTGAIDGWSTVMGAAGARQLTFRDTADTMPSDSEQGYVKTRKQLASGSVSFGAYFTRSDEWRPNMIPVSPNPEIHTDGLDGPGGLYSEQTSGFYSTLPRAVWHKHNEIVDYLLWSHAHLELSPSLELSNEAWFRWGKIRHYRLNDYTLPSNYEHFVERSKTFGDRVVFDARLASIDTLSFGGYVIDSRAVSQYQGYSPSDGSTLAQPESISFNTTNSIDVAGFVEDTFRPIPALQIVPGFRVVQFITDWSNQSPTEACDVYPYMANPNGSGVAPSDCSYGPQPALTTSTGAPLPWSVSYSKSPDESTNLSSTEPSLGVNYALTGGVHIFGSYAISRHNPRSSVLSHYPLDLATIKLVRSETYDFGVRYLGLRVAGMRRLYSSLEFFHTLLSNQTITYSTPQQPLVTDFGYGSATLKGVDFEVRANLTRAWSGFADFGWLKSQWNSFTSVVNPVGLPSYGTNLPVSNSPKDNANFGLAYRFELPSATVKATLWDQYTGIRYLWDNSSGAPTDQQMPAYDLVNFSIRARSTFLGSLIPGVQGSELSLQVLNITNKEYNSTEYISSGGYFGTSSSGYIIANPGAPRAIFATFSADF
jgi:iron complex outermembrane receptor protein